MIPTLSAFLGLLNKLSLGRPSKKKKIYRKRLRRVRQKASEI